MTTPYGQITVLGTVAISPPEPAIVMFEYVTLKKTRCCPDGHEKSPGPRGITITLPLAD